MSAPPHAGVVFMSDLADPEAGGTGGDGANPALDAALAKLGSGGTISVCWLLRSMPTGVT